MHELYILNLQYLEDIENLLSRLTDQQYNVKHSECHNSSVGGHIRHCLDRYASVIGLNNCKEDYKIDYDARNRDELIETQIESAIESLQTLKYELTSLSKNHTNSLSLKIKMNGAHGTLSDSDWQDSSLGRELQSLASHTVHHFALISVMANILNTGLPDGFGVAKSTLAYRDNQNSPSPDSAISSFS